MLNRRCWTFCGILGIDLDRVKIWISYDIKLTPDPVLPIRLHANLGYNQLNHAFRFEFKRIRSFVFGVWRSHSLTNNTFFSVPISIHKRMVT